MEKAFADNYGELWRTARMLSRDASEADDLIQEAFLSALRNPYVAELDERGQLMWLRRAMKNRLIDIRRREKLQKERETLFEEPLICDDLTYVEVVQALSRLSDEQRQVVAMKAFGGMNSSQIARALRIPAPTVRTRLRAAAAKLCEMKRQGDI